MGCWDGKPPPAASSLETEVPVRTEPLGAQPRELWARGADGTQRLPAPGAGAGAAFIGQIQHTAAG